MKLPIVFIIGATALMFIAMRYEAAIFYWLSGWTACRGWLMFIEHITSEQEVPRDE